MNTQPPHPFALYNPGLLPPEILLSEFTARRPLLATLLGIVRENSPGHPPQHVLIVGPRGMGKTTLLWAIAHSITQREPELDRQWQPIVFDEESRRVGNLADFWLECIHQWEAATKATTRHADALLDRPGPDLEDRARETFLRLVDASGKRALLLIDNLNDIFATIYDSEPLLRLRSFLMADSRVMIIGGATRWFEEVTSVDKPFFEFFRPFELRPLSLEEMRECLAGVAQARGDEKVLTALEQRKGSIAALHLLTGGNPRLIRTFYRLLAEGMSGEIRHQLERLVDEFTPYFKAIVDALPGQQQRVLDAVALHWDACDVATVARATRLPSNQVSAQIKALCRAGLVTEVAAASTGKKKAYLLTDRFSNIHYLMRHGRAARRKFDWFVMMVRALFDDAAFAERIAGVVRTSVDSGEAGRLDAELIAHGALRHAGSKDAWCMLLDRLTGFRGYDDQVDPTIAESTSLQAIQDNPKDPYAYFIRGWFLAVQGRYDEAETAFRQAITKSPKNGSLRFSLGNLLQDTGRYVEAEEAYRQAIALDPKLAAPWHNLGNLLQNHLGRYAEAEAAYRQAIALDPKLALTWNNLGVLLQDLGRYAEAEAACRQAIALDPKLANPWHNFGNLLQDHLGRYAEAEEAYRQAITLDPESARSCSGLAQALTKQGKTGDEARTWAVRGLLLDPDLGFTRAIFRRLCFSDPNSLCEALPKLSVWCGSHPEAEAVFDLAVDAWVQLARLVSPVEALRLMDTLPEPDRAPFETLREAFLASTDIARLHRLAPERRALVLRLRERMAG